MARYRWTLCLLLLAILSGCGGGPSDWPVMYDLSAGFIGADLFSETRSIDIGTAAGRRQLVSGWTEDRWDARRKRTFVISRGGESVVAVELIQPRPLNLHEPSVRHAQGILRQCEPALPVLLLRQQGAQHLATPCCTCDCRCTEEPVAGS